MSENQNPTTIFTESPASWNTRFITKDGFTCQLTLRSENGMELLERANSAIVHLREEGCIPFYGYSNNHYQKDNNDTDTNSDETKWCPIHDEEMKQWQKNGKSWFSHKTSDGWCYGKEKN